MSSKAGDKSEGFHRLFAVCGGVDIKHSQRKQAKCGNNQDQEILLCTGHGCVPHWIASVRVIVPYQNKSALI